LLEGVQTLRPYVKLGYALALVVVWQTWTVLSNEARAQTKKPPTIHLPNSGNTAHTTVNHKDIEFEVSDDLKVRRKFAPLQYDDKGKPRKPTATELSQMKGSDPKQPGYSADVYDLKPGQVVQLTLWKQKDDSKPADKNKAATPAKNADAKGNEKDAKPGWVPAGTLTGTLKSYQGSKKKLTVTIDTTTLSGRHQHTNTNNKGKITMPDVQVTFVMIMSQDVQNKEAAAK
jgi:hypothetical protein